MKTFFVGVKSVIIKDGKVLLVRHATKGFWDVPGGRIDGDEAIIDTLGRELREELPNIKSYEMKKLLHAERIHRDIDGEVSLVLLFHLVDAEFDGEPQISEEHTEARWFPFAEAQQIASEGVSAALSKADY